MTYRGAVLDVDGTVVRGERLLAGTRDGLDALDDRGIDRLFVSNNPVRAPPAYAEKLRRAGVEADPEDVLTSGSVTVDYLVDEHADDVVHVIGEKGFEEQCREAGLTLTDGPGIDASAAEPDVCVVSIDREFDYDRLQEALTLLNGTDVPIVGTDPDVVIPGADGDFPGSGAIIEAVAGVAEREPAVVFGKPHPRCRDLALSRLDAAAEECLVVGDRLDTDIALGVEAGMTTVLVKTGVTDDRRLAASEIQPDYVIDSLGDLAQVLDD